MEVESSCWPVFVEHLTELGGEVCRISLLNGGGCEYSTDRSDFIVSPIANEEDRRRVFYISDLRYWQFSPQSEGPCPSNTSMGVTDVLVHSLPGILIIGERTGRAADAAAQRRFPGESLHNTRGDAWRHFRWNFDMARRMGRQTPLLLQIYMKRHRRLSATIGLILMTKRIFLLAVISISATSCSIFISNDVEVANRSDRPITDVRFVYADDVFEQSVLNPEEVFVFEPSPDTDGGITLSYAINGAKVQHQLGYATPAIGKRCIIELIGEEVNGGCEQK